VACYWATAASALLSSIHTAARCLRPGSAMASCRRSRSSMTCARSMAGRGEARSMWSAGGFHASRGVPPVSDWEPPTHGTCGPRWRGSSMKSDPDTCSQRTFPWPHSPNPGETFEGWATESRQLSDLVRATLGAHSRAIAGGYLLPCLTTMQNEWSQSMQKHAGHLRMLYQVGRRLRGGETVVFRHVLMGFPIGWAVLGPLGMPRFQRWLHLHSRN